MSFDQQEKPGNFWRDGYDAKALVRRLVRFRNSPEFDMDLPVLVSAVTWSKAIPEVEKLAIVREAAGVAAAKTPVVPADLEREIKRLAASFLRRPKRDMVLVTSLSASPTILPRTRAVQGARVTFSEGLPARFSSAAGAQGDLASFGAPETPDGYAVAQVKLEARSPRHALEDAMLALDSVRGLWNLILDFKKVTLKLAGLDLAPPNRIVRGPRFSVHKAGGELVGGMVGAVRGYFRVRPLTKAEVPSTSLAVDMKFWRKLKHIPYREELTNGLARYAIALDQTDYGSCLLGLWSLIEFLTGSVSLDNRTTVKRASALFAPREPRRSDLNCLRERRNDVAHAQADSGFGKELVDEARYIVQNLFDFHFTLGKQFVNLGEAGAFLGFTDNTDGLKRQIELRRLFLRYLERASHAALS